MKGLSSRQRSDLNRLMRRIKDAHDENMGEEIVKKRTRELYKYLEDEGIIIPEEYR